MYIDENVSINKHFHYISTFRIEKNSSFNGKLNTLVSFSLQ
jgi:hypothetical protein